MQGLGRVRPHGAKIEPFQDVQHLQDGESLARRREFEDIVAAIFVETGSTQLERWFWKSPFRKKPSIGPHERVHLVGDLPACRTFAPVFGDQPQRSCEHWVPENVAFLGRPAFAIEGEGFEVRARHFFVERPCFRPSSAPPLR